MKFIAEILFWCGFIIACSDGAWFPLVNFAGLAIAILGYIIINNRETLLSSEGK
ncbi:MAG: hypothetical protein OS130_10105 [Thermodesulfobacteriota bacterium]|jgi:hypothetical protein|nr:MAG: hypothetical protein OS130_10105 [Thermodesulfobacteriota bacterium]